MSSERVSSLAVDGAFLHIVEVGPEAARPLVVVHGGPGDAHDVLRPHLDALASERTRVVYYDQRGCGRSALTHGVPGGYREHLDDLAAVCARFPGDVLGFSFGALLALLQPPRPPARLVLVSPVPPHDRAGPEIRRAVERARARPEVAEICRDPRAARIAPFLFDPADALRLAPVETREEVARAVFASMAIGTRDLVPELRGARSTPTLVIHGEADPIPLWTARETAELIGANVRVIPRCGHAPFVEAPSEFGAAVREFLALP